MEIPVGISNRHVHLSKEDYEKLFGNKELTVKKYLKQKGEFASELTVDLKTDKNTIKNVRVMGPLRNRTQVEISLTDARNLGINPPIRMSGNIDKSENITLISDINEINVNECVIIAKRHVHMSTNEALENNLKNGDEIKVYFNGERAGCMENVVVRTNDNFCLEMHIDTDEANAFNIKNEDYVTYKGEKNE